MRYVTYQFQGGARLGAVVDGEMVDLAFLSRLSPGKILPPNMLEFIQMGPTAHARAVALVEALPRLRKELGESEFRWRGIAHPKDRCQLLAPIPRPAKNIVCLGFNYAEHAGEAARARGREHRMPEHPAFFTKAPTCVVGPEAPILIDEQVSTQIDWEGELGVVIGVGGRNIPRERALQHVFGYTAINDVTARDLQARHNQWFKGKSLDTCCPMGPSIVSADEVPDPQTLRVSLRVNGATKQDSNTSFMVFSLSRIIEELSLGMTLEPGDIISTGTPEGVGFARTPQEFLRPGDVVEVEVEGIGVLRNPVARARP